MAEGTEKNEDVARTEKEEIFSKAVRAGKRTYFFDVKATRRNDYYLTLTESKKRFNRDGRFYFEKHKIFLYKEDFDKFSEGLNEVIEFIKNAKPELIEIPETDSEEAGSEEKQVEETIAEEKSESEETEEVKDSDKDNSDENMEESLTGNFSDVKFEDLEDTKEES
ncbi:MAG: hypothetical protein AMS27_07480 [Bacteroides sp. SM23_62_1]|nr:MAG: hypothetical protein AMS27_07480 [Bacteroides sp. SM23_62_1]